MRFATYLVASAFVGFATLTMLTSANATIQTSTDPQMRGRVMSLYMMVLLGTTPLGSPLVGWIANEFGARWSVAVGGIAALLVAVVAALWVWRRWDLTVDYRGGRHPHIHILGPTERLAAEERAARALEVTAGEAMPGEPQRLEGALAEEARLQARIDDAHDAHDALRDAMHDAAPDTGSAPRAHMRSTR